MTQTDRTHDRFIIAIDGGGSKLAGAIARVGSGMQSIVAICRHEISGVGSAHPMTWDAACRNIATLWKVLLNSADTSAGAIEHAVFMLAGAGRAEDVRRVTESLQQQPWMQGCIRITVTSDVQPLLSFAHDVDSTPFGSVQPIVVIAGTGSMVAALSGRDSVMLRAGGWGPVLGDEGSGWRIAFSVIKSLAEWIDQGQSADSQPDTLSVLQSFCTAQNLSLDLTKLSSLLLQLVSDRHHAAKLAPHALRFASQHPDSLTASLVRGQISSLAKQLIQVHSRLGVAARDWRLGWAGGLATNSEFYRETFFSELASQGIAPCASTILDPVDAALHFAATC